MASNGKRPDPRFIVGLVFMCAGVALLAASRSAGVVMIVVGGVLMAAGVAAARKAVAADEGKGG